MKLTQPLRRSLLTAAGAFAASSWLPVHGQGAAFPTKPARIVVPFTPGGSNDVLARAMAQKLSEMWGQPVVVENRPGASGNIGSDAVAKAEPDGHTLLIAANNVMAINPAMFSKMPFDPVKDLEPVTLLGIVPIVLAVRSTLNASSVRELIALVKAKPGGLSYASAGNGTPQHLSAELFKSMTQTNIVHIPYKGAAPAITDLLGGNVDMQFGAINSLLPHIKSGRLRALGVTSTRRVHSLPEVPTVAEAGVPGFESDIWIGLAAPARTPREVVDRINRDVRKVLAMPDVKEKLAEQGIEATTSTPAEMAKVIAADSARWGKLIKDVGIRAD